MKRLRIAAVWLLLFVLAGCATLPPVSELPESFQLEKVGSVTAHSPLAWHPDGRRYAVAAHGLMVGQLNGESRVIGQGHPTAIAWSPTGTFLAAAFISGNVTTVTILDAVDWSQVAEVPVEGKVHDLAWLKDGELVFAAVTVKKFNFGGNYSVRLYHWRQNEELKFAIIADTSPLKSTLAALSDTVYDTVHLQVSPFKDEIVFTRLMAPPNVDPHYQLLVRHLVSGQERLVSKLPLGSHGGRYLPDGDALFYSDGRYQSIAGSIWGTESYETYPAGLQLETSPGGRFKLIDNQLFRDKTVQLRFARIDSAAFSPDGSRLLFIADKKLYLLSSFDDQAVQRVSISPRLLELRRWRSEGLITPQEFIKYYQQLELN